MEEERGEPECSPPLFRQMVLYSHQQEALKKMHNGCILWGGVGSGKSLTGLCYYDIHERPKPLYIITTARKRDTAEWEGELARLGLDAKGEKPPIVIDSWNNIKKYAQVRASFFLFDEQRVVGYGAWTKAFLRIAANNTWILLSATPGDCWMDYLPVFIANGFYKNKTEFQRMHVLYNRFNTRYPQIRGYLNEKLLRKHRDEVLVGMPFDRPTERHDEKVYTAYDMNQYNEVMRTRFNPFTKEPVKEAAELCYILRQIVNASPARLDAMEQVLRRHSRAVIFYNYNYELELIKKRLDEMNWPHSEWNGHRHEPLPTGGRWAYLVQYMAGAEGWNCIETDTMIFYSASYSYKTMTQAAGRIDRLNTGYHDLYYYTFFSTSSIDRAIRRALSAKKTFNESAFVTNFGNKAG